MSTSVTPDQVTVQQESRPTLLARAVGRSTVGPLVALILACIFFTFQSDRFLTGENLSLVVQQIIVIIENWALRYRAVSERAV